jgi:hypothetical protein
MACASRGARHRLGLAPFGKAIAFSSTVLSTVTCFNFGNVELPDQANRAWDDYPIDRSRPAGFRGALAKKLAPQAFNLVSDMVSTETNRARGALRLRRSASALTMHF